MNPALWTGQTGLTAQDKQLSVISNNLANVNTIGFKRDRVVFEDLFYQVQRQPGADNTEGNQIPNGIQMGTGVRVSGTQKVFTTGSYVTTTDQLDMAIEGQGFFQVLQPDGTMAYTRNGQFHLNSDGQMVTANGYPLEPAIEIPEDALSLTVGADGLVSASLAGDPNPQELGQITLANFVNPAGLSALGGNLFAETASSGQPFEAIPGEDGVGAVKQYTLESSNVNMVEEMVNMITAQRGYEMNAKVISAADDMLRFANQTL
ncbi:flagellar basal body rod protein FlgG [Endozoicomonas montiporae]|uniref:Flagellar basal-body rod protein FlgG n=2 Tax=Endozoicomonas montiporae TaxID=1027273 RepID=A0A081NC74_9GAMM|nr:flagellar basal-body rod protein FlgG [Endozoicomonas montiporae]AMO56379.1 lateral flagellar basal-body rod protein FlgG [Endozoicomonas montiporae CL-33]KEQ16047.1 flagellar basal body rod protein FlgG [Endozoicomonas montiporae]